EDADVDAITERMKMLELGMWDSVKDMERWNSTKVEPAGIREQDVPDTTMTSPIPDVVPWPPAFSMDSDLDLDLDLDLELSSDLNWDVVMESPITSWSVDMEIDSTLMDVPPTFKVSPGTDRSFSTPSLWGSSTLLKELAPVWTLETYEQDVWMEDSDAFSVAEFENEEMEGVIENAPTEVTVDISGPQTPEIAAEDVRELVEDLEMTWDAVEDSDSDDEATVDEAEADEEAELDALEEEHFAAAADDFLAGLGAELAGN
ncbi:unnamed protein product, partial [Rhizoctonia solani]